MLALHLKNNEKSFKSQVRSSPWLRRVLLVFATFHRKLAILKRFLESDNKCFFFFNDDNNNNMVKINLITYSRVSELPNCVWCRQFVLQSFRECFSKLEGFISHREQRETNLRSLLPSRNCIRLRSGRSQTFLGALRRKKFARAVFK